MEGVVIAGVETACLPCGNGLSSHERSDVRQSGPLMHQACAYGAGHTGQAKQAFHSRAQAAILGDVRGEPTVT
ncbi:hypothetical protein GCM10010270_01350 [Streptomyces violaceus]|jgi:hypothetical protein|nr:hypothetical protein GCM10010270_01350 [Streptomyces janthinus]